MASSFRSLRGYTLSSDRAPSFSKGGSATAGISVSRLRPFPARHARSMSVVSRMYSRERSGSASIRSRPSRPEAIPAISSRRSSSADSKGTGGASSDWRMFSGTPAVEPGV